MTPQALAKRVERLEEGVSRLEELPGRMDRFELQMVQLRGEMRDEFFAIRSEVRAGDDAVISALRDEIRAGDEETRRVLREEIRAGDQETRNFMRMLFEEYMDRLKKADEANPAPSGARKGRTKRQ